LAKTQHYLYTTVAAFLNRKRRELIKKLPSAHPFNTRVDEFAGYALSDPQPFQRPREVPTPEEALKKKRERHRNLGSPALLAVRYRMKERIVEALTPRFFVADPVRPSMEETEAETEDEGDVKRRRRSLRLWKK
jgi:hypothetical protein